MGTLARRAMSTGPTVAHVGWPKKRTGTPFSRGFWKALAAGAVVLLLAEFAVGAIDMPTVARLLLQAVVILAGYGFILIGFGLAAEERELVRKFWRSVFG